jgi:hypothetical protein
MPQYDGGPLHPLPVTDLHVEIVAMSSTRARRGRCTVLNPVNSTIGRHLFRHARVTLPPGLIVDVAASFGRRI